MKRSHVLLLVLLLIVIVIVLVLLLWFFVFKTKTLHNSHHDVFPLPENFVSSRATHHGSPDGKGNPKGACGYGEFGRDINNGEVSAVSSRLWKSGTGCGACYQVRCKVPTHCNKGVHVVATDYGEGDRTDFILSPKAYERMAEPGKEGQLNSFGVVDVEYQRVPCQYAAGHNLVYEVQEKSNPHYLALLVLYVGGVNDILAVEVCQEDCKEWQRMRSAFGAVHDLQNPPRGTLSLRLSVNGTAGPYWVQSPNALPANWTAGTTYNSTADVLF